MSLYLVEMKIKTALELVNAVEQNLEDIDLPVHESVRMKQAHRNINGLRNILREIINRPKEEDHRG